MRHLTSEERLVLRQMVDNVGHGEILNLVANMFAHDNPDLQEGVNTRIAINKISAKMRVLKDPVGEN